MTHSYQRQTYRVRTYTLTVPAVDNTGQYRSDHLAKVRKALAASFPGQGWTEHRSSGFWNGKIESGTVVTIYAPADYPPAAMIESLGAIGRNAMPDQDAVQVTASDTLSTLTEA